MADQFFENAFNNVAHALKTTLDASEGLTSVQQGIEVNKVLAKGTPLLNSVFAESVADNTLDRVDISNKINKVLIESGGENLSAQNRTAVIQQFHNMYVKRLDVYGKDQVANMKTNVTNDFNNISDMIANNLVAGHTNIDEALEVATKSRESLKNVPLDEGFKDQLFHNMKAQIYSSAIPALTKTDPNGAKALLNENDVKESLSANAYLTLSKIVESSGESDVNIVNSKLNSLQAQIMTGNFNRDDILSQASSVSEEQFLQRRMSTFSQIRSLPVKDLRELEIHAEGANDPIRAKMLGDRADALATLIHNDPVEAGANMQMSSFQPLDFSSATTKNQVEARAMTLDKISMNINEKTGAVEIPNRLFSNNEIATMSTIMEHGTAVQKNNVIDAVAKAYSLRGNVKELPSELALSAISKAYGGNLDINAEPRELSPREKLQDIPVIRKYLTDTGIADYDDAKQLAVDIKQRSKVGSNANQAIIKFFGPVAYQKLHPSATSTKVSASDVRNIHGEDLYLDNGDKFNSNGLINTRLVYAGDGQYFYQKPRFLGIFGSDHFVTDKLGNRIRTDNSIKVGNNA